jgi:hypothetical protein
LRDRCQADDPDRPQPQGSRLIRICGVDPPPQKVSPTTRTLSESHDSQLLDQFGQIGSICAEVFIDLLHP